METESSVINSSRRKSGVVVERGPARQPSRAPSFNSRFPKTRRTVEALKQRAAWAALLRERLSEPLHISALSLLVLAFGSFRAKVYFDIYRRPQHAFGLLYAADQANRLGVKTITAIEFGVATGAGLVNICDLAATVSKETGVNFNIVGFDSGQGMPPPRDYRDQSHLYAAGDFPMANEAQLDRYYRVMRSW